MKILDRNANPINACAVFDYKGFEISSSSVMSQRAMVDSIVVWDSSGAQVGPKNGFDTVEKAIAEINAWVSE